MAISRQLVLESIEAISSVRDVQMNPDSLAEDVALLARPWPEEDEFRLAVASTVRALKAIAAGSVTPASLKYNLNGWQSYHYQHKVAQGQRADMRIVFQIRGEKVRVKAFGHRNLPQDLYERIASTRQP